MQNVQTQGRQGIEGPMQGPLPQGVARGIEQQPAPGQRGFILDYHGPHGPRRDEPLKRAGQPLTQPCGSAGLKAPALGSQLKDKGLRSLPSTGVPSLEHQRIGALPSAEDRVEAPLPMLKAQGVPGGRRGAWEQNNALGQGQGSRAREVASGLGH